MTQLGIVVVYLVNEENERLLDLHLQQIERYTHVPYTIYGSANRLLPRFKTILERHQVNICDCPTTEFRGVKEHAYYLDQLIKIAFDDGATHVVTMHVDSFPVRSDWAETLIEKLTGKCVLASIMRDAEADHKPNTACLFLRRDFYLTYQPTLLLSDSELHSPDYERYRKAYMPAMDSGIGYGFKVFAEGLDWYPLPRSNIAEAYFTFGGIYGDLVFHLGGATWVLGNPTETGDGLLSKMGTAPWFHKSKELAKRIVPPALRRHLGVPLRIRPTLVTPVLERRRRQLFDDPDAFLEYLRTGKT